MFVFNKAALRVNFFIKKTLTALRIMSLQHCCGQIEAKSFECNRFLTKVEKWLKPR